MPKLNLTYFRLLADACENVLRLRGEWHGNATAHADIDWVVNRLCDIARADDGAPEIDAAYLALVIAELKHRAGY